MVLFGFTAVEMSAFLIANGLKKSPKCNFNTLKGIELTKPISTLCSPGYKVITLEKEDRGGCFALPYFNLNTR